MSVTPLPPATHELDRRLREFFRQEMPNPWPQPQVPADAAPALQTPRRPLLRSRLALAASLGALLIGQWKLGGIPSRPLPPSGSGASERFEATRKVPASTVTPKTKSPTKAETDRMSSTRK